MPYLTPTQYSNLMGEMERKERVEDKLKKAAGKAAAYLVAKSNNLPTEITAEQLLELLDNAILEKGV